MKNTAKIPKSQRDNNRKEQNKPSPSVLLVEIISNKDISLFHDADGNTYASITRNSHFEHLPLLSKEFSNWLSYQFYQEHGKAPSKNALNDALNTLSGKALYEGEEHETFVRVAKKYDKYYLDLCNENWQAIEISASGWHLVSNVFGADGIKFRRTSAMRSLPNPDKIGAGFLVAGLNRHTNIVDDDLILVIAWILECFRPETPFPVLEIRGEQGSAKSTTQNWIRNLIDPNRVNLRAAPSKIEDLFVAAINNRVITINNASFLKNNIQDALCSLSTGGGHASRTLYSNLDETIADVKGPVIMNGIATLATQPDLVDRTIRINLPTIKAENRKTESEIQNAFLEDWPKMVGSLLSLLAEVLERIPNIHLKKLPRMADFAILGEAVVQVLGWSTPFQNIR